MIKTNLLERKVLVEVKSTEILPPYTRRTVGNYLTATTIEVALILHFGPEAKFYRTVCSNR